MLNPAWRPAQAHNTPLDAFRRAYASPAEPEAVIAARPAGVQVIRTWTSDSGQDEIAYLVGALERQLNLPGNSPGGAQWRWRLHAATGSPPARPPDFPLLLLLCEADLAALRSAYVQLKHLHPGRDATLSVIIQGARNEVIARRYYRRLAMGSLRFLDLPLLFCGAAPRRGELFSQEIARLAQTLRQQFAQKAVAYNIQGEQ